MKKIVSTLSIFLFMFISNSFCQTFEGKYCNSYSNIVFLDSNNVSYENRLFVGHVKGVGRYCLQGNTLCVNFSKPIIKDTSFIKEIRKIKNDTTILNIKIDYKGDSNCRGVFYGIKNNENEFLLWNEFDSTGVLNLSNIDQLFYNTDSLIFHIDVPYNIDVVFEKGFDYLYQIHLTEYDNWLDDVSLFFKIRKKGGKLIPIKDNRYIFFQKDPLIFR